MHPGSNISETKSTGQHTFFNLLHSTLHSVFAVINSLLQCLYPNIYSGLWQAVDYSGCLRFVSFVKGHRINHTHAIKACVSWISIVFVLALSVSILACQSQAVVGVKKDFVTGLKTEYKNMEPETTMLVMNDEVLNHTDIPLGEQFVIVNKGVKGLTEKEGKISVGCSLQITDTKGNVILNEPDLFKDNGTIDAQNADYLKCIVTTGKPMEWEEHYNVKTGFWDKWGDGKIINEVTIRTIDIP